ncbi:MAG: hypothetical protein IIY39_00035 [Firmicutes bacterium]|nr:hypothetical protein [Bacillota bacterium]
MSRYIKFDDAVKVMACEMYAEAQSQGYDADDIEDFMPEATAWLNDAPSIDIEPKRGEWIKSSAVDIAWGEKAFILAPIVGESRIGKTTSALTVAVR